MKLKTSYGYIHLFSNKLDLFPLKERNYIRLYFVQYGATEYTIFVEYNTPQNASFCDKIKESLPEYRCTCDKPAIFILQQDTHPELILFDGYILKHDGNVHGWLEYTAHEHKG